MPARLLALMALAMLPASQALACAVCGAGQKDPAADAFFASTVLMSLVPVGMIAGIISLIVRGMRKSAVPDNEAP